MNFLNLKFGAREFEWDTEYILTKFFRYINLPFKGRPGLNRSKPIFLTKKNRGAYLQWVS